MTEDCRHCDKHDLEAVKCDCGHDHNDHTFSFGCKKCKCERYSQLKRKGGN